MRKTYWCSGKQKAHSHGPDIAAKLVRTQRHLEHVWEIRNQSRLTKFFVPTAMPHSSWLPSVSTSAAPLWAVSAATSRVSSTAMLRVSSVASSRAPSIVPSLGPSLHPPSSHDPSPVGLSEGRSGSDSNDNSADSSHEVGGGNASDREEDDMDNFMETSGSRPKAKEDIRSWKELWEQLKLDWLEGQKKNERPTHLNKLTILQNFTMLHIKGVRCITASKEIAQVWQDGVGTYFACQIQFLTWHYQLFKQLPEEK